MATNRERRPSSVRTSDVHVEVADGDTVTLWVREHSERFCAGCKDLGILSYVRATVRRLPPGRYHVRVESDGRVVETLARTVAPSAG
jgi:hypothetical protein